jgi:hypothetical protein
MKTAISLLVSLTVSIALQSSAFAQVPGRFSKEQMMSICNTIYNLHDRNPRDLQLTSARRECNFRFYLVRLCMATRASVTCWEEMSKSSAALDGTADGDIILVQALRKYGF